MSLTFDARLLTSLNDQVAVGIIPFDPSNPLHHRALKETIYGEALVHGEALFREAGFAQVAAAAGLKKITAEFVVAAIEHCAPMVVGGAIRHASAMFDIGDNGEAIIWPAERAEDTSFSRSTSKIIRELTTDRAHPDGIGIGSWYMKERLKRAKGIKGFVSEFADDNHLIINTYKKFSTLVGSGADSAIFEVTGLTSAMHNRRSKTVEIDSFTNGPHELDGLFLTHWASDDGRSKIFALFTDGLSTYKGKPLTHVQIKSSGPAPDQDTLKNVLASLLAAGDRRLRNRYLNEGIIPRGNAVGPSTICIQILQDQRIKDALYEMNLPIRSLGGRPMRPALMLVPDAHNLKAYRRINARDRRGDLDLAA